MVILILSIDPIMDRSIEIMKQVVEQSRLGNQEITKPSSVFSVFINSKQIKVQFSSLSYLGLLENHLGFSFQTI